MEINLNPFINSRREYESGGYIFIPEEKEGYQTWISGQHILFEGIRGSGKTSILRSIEYDTVWGISSTKLIMPDSVDISSQPKHFGVKYKLDEMDIDRWESWKDLIGQKPAQDYFGSYTEYVILDTFLTALLHLMDEKPDLFKDNNAEEKLIEDILIVGFPTSFKPVLREYSIRAIRKVIQETHNAIRLNVYYKISYETMKTMYPILSPGSLIKAFSQSLVTNFNVFKETTVIPMLDDFNHLKSWQMQVINTSIFKAETPVSYKLTSVSGLEIDLTTIDGDELTGNVIRKILLAGLTPGVSWDQTEKKLDKLVQGVCRSRIEEKYGIELAKKFNYKEFLGSFDVERLLYKMLSNSQQEGSLNLLRTAETESKETNKIISITYTWMKLNHIRNLENIESNDPREKRLLKNREISTYVKKWKYGASIAICKQYKLKYPYGGWQVVLHLSYGSVREVLRIFYQLWEELGLPINKFVNKKNVPFNSQKESINIVSTRLLSALDKKPKFECKDLEKKYMKYRIDYNPTSLPSFCLRLGDLFSKLQSYPFIRIQPEIGSIRVKSAELDTDILAFIEDGISRGVILKYKDKNGKIRIGLHTILSPLFNISYRSPFYHPIDINANDFKTLVSGSDLEAINTTDNILFSKIRRHLDSHPEDESQLGKLLPDYTKPKVSKQQLTFTAFTNSIEAKD